jgi:peptide/nickel transport system permease protein
MIVRLMQAIGALLGAALVGFVLLHGSGDPTYAILPPDTPEAVRAEYRQTHGLNDPLPLQFGRYTMRLLRGDLGESLVTQEPVARMLGAAIPATFKLALAAQLLGIAVSVPLGCLAAYRRYRNPGSRVDAAATLLFTAGQALPTFFVGILLILLFAVSLRALPVSGRGTPAHLVLPCISIAVFIVAVLGRLTRTEMLEALREDYARTARAKGLSEVSVLWHVLRNVLVTLVTMVGLEFGGLLAGAVTAEFVFAWPGLGLLMLQAVAQRDLPVVLGALLFSACMVIMVNLAVDLLYSLVDPRIRRGERA